MSFANTSVGNTYRPDRRILDSIAALTARVSTLELEKNELQARAAVSETENAELRTGLSLLLEWAKTLTLTDGSRGASG